MPEGEEDDRLDGEELEDGLVWVDEFAHRHIELDEAVHGHCDGDTDEHCAPNMREPWHPAMQTVIAKVFRAHGNECAKGSNDGVLKYTDLHEPQKVQSFGSILPPSQGEDPEVVFHFDVAKYSMLLRRRITGVGQDEVEERSNEDGFVAVADGLVVESFFVEEVGHERDDGVDGDHDKEPDNVSLLLRAGIVCEMLPYEPKGRDAGDEGHDAAYEPANVVGFEIEVAVLEERFGIVGLVRNGRTGHVDHDGRGDDADCLL